MTIIISTYFHNSLDYILTPILNILKDTLLHFKIYVITPYTKLMWNDYFRLYGNVHNNNGENRPNKSRLIKFAQ